MNFPVYIAKRYLFTKTGNNAINIITIIASFGVIVGTLALFIILSGFSGLRTFSYSMLDVSDPDIKITSSKGKNFFYTNEVHQLLEGTPSVKVISRVIEERVFLSYNDKNEIAYIKGVENNYTSISKIDSVVSLGNWLDKLFMYITIWRWDVKFKHFDRSKFNLALRSTRNVSKHHPQDFQTQVLTRVEESKRAIYAKLNAPK